MSVTMSYASHLEIAINAARKAGELLRAELALPKGPRGSGGKAPADNEAEAIIRDALEAAFPGHGIVGEELSARNRASKDADDHRWLVDPNDGTKSFVSGYRGAAVSIALLRKDLPVLGVVYAYAAPDNDGDLIAWAEGQPLTRNGVPITREPLPAVLTGEHTVLVSQHADQKSALNAELTAPARFRAVPSVAYRLALVAVGEGEAGVSLAGPTHWDVAAGHALLRAVGGELYTMGGKAVRYDGSGIGNVIGGAPQVCLALVKRPWSKIHGPAAPLPATRELGDLVWPARGVHALDAGILARAQGCLLGQLAGDALGSLVEFRSKAAITTEYPGGVREMRDGGTWSTIAGQPTDDSELALALARALVREGQYDSEVVAQAYAAWIDSKPFDCGNTIGTALRAAAKASRSGDPAAVAAAAAANTKSQANGALMRISPLAIFGHALASGTLLEASASHGGSLDVDPAAIMRKHVPSAELLAWKQKSEAFVDGKVHAKVAIADARRAFITSANLTGHALARNMEAGVAISGGAVPKALHDHLEALVEVGILGVVED